MSGSEIIESIEKHTGGFWKPSPGSIYPLLAWLQDHAFIKDLPVENGLKRYELTDNGNALLKEQERIRKKFVEEAGLPPASFFDSFLMKIPPEKTEEIRQVMKRLALSFFKLGGFLQENFSEQAINDALAVLEETAEKLEEITIKNENGEKQ